MSDHSHQREPPPLRATPSALAKVTAVLLFLGIWFYVFPYFEQLRNPNEMVRLYMTAALVDEGQYEISPIRERWGWVNDAACVERPGDTSDSPPRVDHESEIPVGETEEPEPSHDGSLLRGNELPCDGPTARGATRSYYSVKAPMASLLAVPGYAFARFLHGDALSVRTATAWSRLTSSAIPCVFFLWFFYGYLGSVTRSAFARDLGFLVFVCGSVFLGYSFMLASHSTSAAATFGAFMLLHNARRRKRTSALKSVLAGVLAASVSALEYPCFVITCTLCLYALVALKPRRNILAFGIGALIPTLLVMHFQWSCFGSPFLPGHLFVENPGFRAAHEQGFFGADRFHGKAAFSLLLGGRDGLFITTPFFALLFIGIRNAWRRRRLELIVSACSVLALYLLICTMNNWRGGWSIGPRYLVAVLPFATTGAVIGCEQLCRNAPRRGAAIALTLAWLSIISAGTVSVLYPHVPTEIRFPLFSLVPKIVDAGRAPYNLFGGAGASHIAALLPLLAIAVFGVLAVARRQSRFAVAWSIILAAGVLAVGARMHDRIEPPPEETHAIGYVLRSWEP